MTPAERTAKIAELRAEADRLEREGKRDPIAGLLDAKRSLSMIKTAPERGFGLDYMVVLACSSMEAIDERIAALSEPAIKTPDAPEPTGAELVGKVCEFSDGGKEWEKGECVRYEPGRDFGPYLGDFNGGKEWFISARLYLEDRP